MEEHDFPNLFEDEIPPEKLPPVKRLERSSSDYIITGLCGGLGKYFSIDPSKIRVAFMFSVLLGGWVILLYFIASVMIPLERTVTSIITDKKNNLIFLSSLMMTSGLYLFLSDFNLTHRTYFLLDNRSTLMGGVLIITGIYVALRNKRLHPVTEENQMKFYRSQKNKIITGLCGGLADYLSYDAAVIRTVFLISVLLTAGFSLILYLLMSLFVGKETGAFNYES
ncbi:PspC domain-containing protein [Melioribacter sp. Ez-97]|uniref:PspC domain-containing protein n=1 Tax=Melioribacter sp. Ez-97 TaxID=3423434 RepID=UPI003EDA1B21